MDAAIADAINREDARKIAEFYDATDQPYAPFYYVIPPRPWYYGPMAETFMGENDATNGDRAWLIGQVTVFMPGLRFDGAPADCDWDGFFANIRAEIEARRTRDPSAPSVRVQPLCGMV